MFNERPHYWAWQQLSRAFRIFAVRATRARLINEGMMHTYRGYTDDNLDDEENAMLMGGEL